MAKTNYTFEKRKKEIAKKQKQEQKRTTLRTMICRKRLLTRSYAPTDFRLDADSYAQH